MNIDDFNKERAELNKLMTEHDDFFAQFGKLDDRVYADGPIPKKYKELIGLVISIASKCDECVLYHLQGCQKENVSTAEIVDAIKLAVLGTGSVAYPSARYAFKTMKELNML